MAQKNSELFRIKTYLTKDADAVVFFGCPFGSKNWLMRPYTRKLQRAGYTVVAYDCNNSVFLAADTDILVQIINGVRKDIKQKVADFKTKGMKEFGFFGSSLGSFIMFNCVNDIPELKWGIFNTGGSVSEAVWNTPQTRKAHQKKGISLENLKESWHELQYPLFENLKGRHFAFVSSKADKIVPFSEIDQYFVRARKVGADIQNIEIKAIGHKSAVLAALRRAPQLLERVRKAAEVDDLTWAILK